MLRFYPDEWKLKTAPLLRLREPSHLVLEMRQQTPEGVRGIHVTLLHSDMHHDGMPFAIDTKAYELENSDVEPIQENDEYLLRVVRECLRKAYDQHSITAAKMGEIIQINSRMSLDGKEKNYIVRDVEAPFHDTLYVKLVDMYSNFPAAYVGRFIEVEDYYYLVGTVVTGEYANYMRTRFPLMRRELALQEIKENPECKKGLQYIYTNPKVTPSNFFVQDNDSNTKSDRDIWTIAFQAATRQGMRR